MNHTLQNDKKFFQKPIELVKQFVSENKPALLQFKQKTDLVDQKIHQKTLIKQPQNNQNIQINGVYKKNETQNWKPKNRIGNPYIIYQNILYTQGGIGGQPYDDIHSLCLNDQQWKYISNKEIVGFSRYNHAISFYKNYLVVFGGVGQFGKKRGFMNDIQAFSMLTQKWEIWQNNQMLVSPRFDTGFCSLGQYLLVSGGRAKSECIFNDFFIYDMENRKWIHQGKLCIPLHSHSAVGIKTIDWEKTTQKFQSVQKNINILSNQFEQGIFLFGGKNDSQALNPDLYILNLKMELVKTQGQPPCPRMQHGSCYHEDNNMLIIHGGKDLHRNFYKDIYCLNIKNLSWIRVGFSSTVCDYRAGHSIFVYKGELIILGGYDHNGYKSLDLHIIQLGTQIISEKTEDINIPIYNQQKIRYFKDFNLDQ